MAVGALLAIVGAGLWFLLLRDAPLMPAANSETAADPRPRDASKQASPSPTAGATSRQEGEARTVVAAAPEQTSTTDAAVLRGRVVDTDGVPIAGVLAKVHGWGINGDAVNAHRAVHGAVEWADPEQVVTATDGRFEIAFVPPPPFQFTLGLTCEGRVGSRGRWDRIEPGEVKDFGDVTMEAGARITGRLVDRAGSPVVRPAGTRFQLSIDRSNRRDRPRGDIVPVDGAWCDVASDGSFTVRDPVRPGTWQVSLRGLLPVEREQEFEVVAPATALEVEVFRPDEVLRVAGVVVDDTGAPVPQADFEPLGIERASSWILHADREGRFEFEQRPDALDPAARFRLRFEEAGYGTVTTDELRWGDTELRVVMPRLPVMEVLVLRAHDRSPVEEYGLRVMNTGGRRSSNESEVRGGWEHPGGVTRITTLQDGGLKRLIVEPRQGSGLAVAMEHVDIDLAAPPRPTILLPDAAERVVRIQDTEGRPVVGSRVEVIDAGGEEITAATRVTDPGSRGWSSAELGVLTGIGISDEAGEARVMAPSGVPVSVRCTGAHPPWIANGVVLDGGLMVTVAEGATLKIRFEPADVVSAWLEEARDFAALRNSEDLERHRPWVTLRCTDDGGRQTFPAGSSSYEGARMEPSGLVELRGVPEGNWLVTCRRYARLDADRFETAGVDHPESVGLRNGTTTELVFDVSTYRTGTVIGRVLSGGEPLAETSLRGQREVASRDSNGDPRVEWVTIQTDAEGRFRRQVPVGRYAWTAAIELPVDGSGTAPRVDVRALPDTEVGAGEEIEVELEASLARADLRILGPDGEPVRGLPIYSELALGSVERPTNPKPTDPDGNTSVFGTAGSFRFRCRIRSLVDEAAFYAFVEELTERHGGSRAPEVRAGLEDAVVELGQPVVLSTGQAGKTTIRLPPAWDR